VIYLISDLHSKIDFAGIKEYCDIAKKDDLLIILGDVGLEFENTEENRKFTDYILSIDKNIAIMDGNHDNFAFLNSFPTEEWNGGIVGRLTKNIIHLKRGNIYTIEGKSFFAFGGCKSSPKWKEQGLWHEGEEPTQADYDLARENLKKHDYKVDYILTHKYEQTPTRGTVCEELREFTLFLEEKVEYKQWYSGHWHRNQKVDEKHMLVYDQPKKVY
jgi:predicted phosphodiesterase